MDNKEINEIRSVIESLKASDLDVSDLAKEVKKRGLEDQIDLFTKEYGDKLKDFIDSNHGLKSMSKDDKVNMIMELQNKMTPQQRKQFKSVMEMLKNIKKRGK